MLKTILIDDEALAIRRLRRLLLPFEHVIDVVGEALDGEQAVQLITAKRPDLIFLDIQMPGMNGFEVVEQLERLPLIIFVTAYDQYALRAFETNSIDYLLKPVEPARLQHAIDKLLRLRQAAPAQPTPDMQQHIAALLAEMKANRPYRLQVRSGDRVRFLDGNDIYYFRAADKYVEVHTFDAMYLLPDSLSAIEKSLPARDFVRIHRAAIINMRHLDEAARDANGQYRVRMKNQKRTVLPVSRRARHKLGLS